MSVNSVGSRLYCSAARKKLLITGRRAADVGETQQVVSTGATHVVRSLTVGTELCGQRLRLAGKTELM